MSEREALNLDLCDITMHLDNNIWVVVIQCCSRVLVVLNGEAVPQAETQSDFLGQHFTESVQMSIHACEHVAISEGLVCRASCHVNIVGVSPPGPGVFVLSFFRTRRPSMMTEPIQD